MSDSNNSSSIGIFGLMFIVLFAGKVLAIGPVADWSWWIVTAPLWVFPVSLLTLATLIFLFGVVVDVFSRKDRR